MVRTKDFLVSIIFPLTIVVAWFYATTVKGISGAILPEISEVIATFKSLAEKGSIQQDVIASLIRVLKGYFLAVSIGVIVGALSGMNKFVKTLIIPVATAIRQVPIIAWIPLIILWCGIGEESKVVVIVVAATFPIMVNTMSGVASTPDSFLEVAHLYKLSKWEAFLKVYMPNALPNILVGLKLGMGASWMAVVAAEMLGATSGIGYRLNDARSMLKSDQVILCIIIIGAIGILSDLILSYIFKKITPWENKR
ncbi:sulfonate transport system permease protein [Pseudobutyrivibrio sp. 49]|uniref:ABC transporter permease n=1 Tax=Pseudobutyrivibrio sp. 49 TaxID=1855344 RepID=UPI0008865453|nr:ABC transporter permease [Pseudobutyrivibrio sp. 49]SDI14269.1 sulfonate transport system permease protein [Pseudobutyrivibrio sp. 49]